MPSKRLGILNYEEKGILGPTQGRSFIYMVLLSLFHQSLFFRIPFHKDLHFPFIFTPRLSSSYTWRVEIAFLELLSHPKHTGKLLPCNLSCATTIQDHFLINAARGVVVLHLMRKR